MIKRKTDVKKIRDSIAHFRVTAILGPRQSGKTTISRQFEAADYFDLENPRDLKRLETPQLALEGLKGLIVIDEIQRKPDLFPLIRFLVDSQPDQKYLILGSASPDLLRQSSESLAGRISFYHLFGFRMHDIGLSKLDMLWLRGGFPPSFLAEDNSVSAEWRENYISTYLERDIPQFGITIPSDTLRRFWQMISHYHGNIFNFSEIGRSFDIADTTVRKYLDILKSTFMVRVLQPWYVNLGKRLVKRPKIYFRDSGLLHSLLAVESDTSLKSHPKLGSSWEGFALEQVWSRVGKKDELAYFWSTHSGAEVDLFWQHEGKNWACEFKYSDAPGMTRSIQSALKDLELEKLWIVYPGKKRYTVAENVIVLPLSEVHEAWDY